MIQIKRNNKVFFTLEDFGEGSKLSYQLMDHHYVILKFTTATPIYFEIGDSVEIPDFGYFELTSSYFPKHNDSDGYDYEMQMDAYYMSWKNKLCKYRPQHGANETSFKLTTTVGVHMNVILGNLKALGLTYNGKEFSVDYTTYNNKAFDVQKRFLIEYGSISILDALNAICSEDALNCEWWIDGSIIYLGYCEMEGQTTFEQDVNVLSMSYSESKSTYITRLYAFGSDRNIPKGYFTGADADVTTDGVATDYLMLPNKEVDSDGFYAKDGYLENVNVVKNDKQAIEGVVMFEEEYPRVESVVSSIKTYDSTVDNEDGTKTTQTFWQVTSTDSFTNSFKESWIKSNLTLGIKFTSGALMGMEFEVSFKVIDKANYFEIVANDTYGRTLPDGVMCPKVGDKFFLYNWDATKITDTDLIPTAQLSLFDRAKQYYQKTMISNSNFTCTMDGEKFYNDGTYDYHPLGEQVKLINDMFAQVDADGKHYRNSRIIGMEIPLDIPYDHPQYTVGEKAATSRLGKLEDKVDSITVNGMQIGGTGRGNGGVYVIGLNDSTPASDSNVYSARRSRMEFVSRLQDNTAKGTITWEKIQKLLSGLLVGNSNSENGGSWTPDTEGRSHLITDYLEVRMKAIFEELVVKKTSTIGGKEIISPAGGVVAHKVEVVTVTYNNVSQKAYRCYFLAEQEGDSVDNDFSVNDQVRSESFNVRKGTYHKVGNHFYWRLVIGRDEEPVELEGKKYHYIDLSDTDCATASDVPAKGDVLNQCGNRTDVERQNCLIFSAVDTYSPSIGLYHGINSYSFVNKEYVEYGVNKQTNKAFFNVYGDMYVGDRPTKENGYEGSSYIKYDSATKQVSVKGKISAKSTVDGKELSQYIKENSAGGLTEEQVNNLIKNSQVIADLQNQVDGAIETWFYEGVPTLKNAPASSWTTDKDKDTHLGDLYYDNKTGKAYRFAKDGNTYKWTVITDTDIAKALSDASKAQETADGKMKVFSTQPIPPYQLGDIWVNATYPTDGSTYKNEILRCQTAKTKGSSFAIADWTKASKYTDDSALNTFKEEYKNDMASYKEQLDEKVETWFYNYAPTTQNKPASDWTTDTLKSQHAGDLFYNTSNGYTYRWTGTAWARIKDNDINTAMTAASKAQDTADGKRTVFTSQPTVPYDEGDLWASGGDDGKTLMVCVKSRVTGSFTSSEWVKANDSDLNAFAKTIEKSLTGIRDQLDKKAETWYQATDPSTSWTTDDAKKEHKGDLWYNTSNNQTFFWNGAKWDKQDVPTEVFDKIDGKSSIYVSKPASYEERDLWILEAAYTLGGVAYSKGELVVATKTNASFSAADWTKKVKYTDDTVANAAKKAAEEAKKAADTAQTNVTNLGKTVISNKKAFDNYVTDGYLEPSEIAAMAQDSKRLEDAFAAAEKSYNEVKGAEVLKSTKELTDLNTAFATLTTAKTELVTYLSDISNRYNAADTNGKATIVSAVGTKFTNFQSAYSAFYDKLGLANAYITSKIYGDLKQNITDLAGYKYIKDALGQTTDIDGGLVMTTLLALRDADGNVQSGINGAIDPNRGKKSIATWWGGQMVDKDYNSGSLTPATSLIRFDGSGYLANGAIWWDVDGKVHADPTSFIISKKNLGAYLTFFEPTWKAGSAGTSVADLVSLKPNAPFSKLGVSGDATFEGAITFHGIKITYDATNKAIKIDGNLYATGGITAYGAGASTTGGGGGLNASVISYARIIEGSYTDADLTSIPNAYAIKALSSRIDNIATELGGLNLSWNNITGKPSTYTPSAHTHKWADITDRITKVSQLTNDSGYTKNTGTVTSVSLTLPAGLTCATKTITTSGTFAISLASGYSIPTTAKQTAWDGAVSAKHTHSNKSVLDGISSTKVSHWNSAYDWYALMTTDEETADGIINKWNEVVSFLANIAQTDTLSGIVDGINKSISDEVARAKKAEGVNASGISANKGSIATLQGYFTNGSAKKALQLTNARKLWGNSFNGTADINGSIIVPSGKYISIGNIKLEYDAANKALKITNTTTNEVANLYTSGGVSAYGVGTSSSSGGGLNGSVKAYADAIRLTTENLSEIASAYSVAKLYSEIQNVASAVPSISVSVPTGGNALTGATYDASTGVITFAKGTFLTAHQSLDGYVNAIAVSGSGNAVTAVTKSGKTITFTKGATYLTSHQSLSNYYTKSSVDSLLNGKSATTHTHSVKINGVTKTIAATGGTAVDLGTYLTSHQSLAGYATQSWVNSKGYITSSGSCAYATSAGNADTVDGEHASAFTRIVGRHTFLTSGTAPYNYIHLFRIANSDGYSTLDCEIDIRTRHHSAKIEIRISTAEHPYNNGGSSISIVKKVVSGRTCNLWFLPTVQSSNYNYYDVYYESGAWNSGSYGITLKGTNGTLVFEHKGTKLTSLPDKVSPVTDNVAATATKLQTARKLWGNSFNGTADINGSIIVPSGKYISIGNIKMEYDATNKALKITNTTTNEVANLYTSGGVSAYGVGTSTSTGGGLNGSVKSYADALKLTSESLSEIASAYSIKQLSTRITSLEGGSATSISVSGSGNAVTSVTKNGTTITVTKGATFLTAHQSLSAYMKTADAKSLFLYHTREKIVTDLDNFNTSGASHIYEMYDVTNTPTDNDWLQVMNWGSADANYGMLLANDYNKNGSLYFRHKVAGKWNAWKTLIDSSNIANQSVKYATTAGTAKNPNALSWSGYASGSYDGSAAKSISIPNNTNQLTNGAGFITSSASITGNAATATKLATARNIALGHDFRGSANFDGTGNITINGHINAAIISLGSTDPSPFKRIAHVQVSDNYRDYALLLYLSQGYIGGSFGICRVEFRTNDVSEAGSAVASVKWLFRYGYATDYVQVGFYSAKHNSYMDVFVKTTGGYQGTVIRCLQDSRGSINSNVSLLKATATTEAYTSIEAAATALYKLAYTAIVKGSDAGAVNYANSAGNAGTLDGIHANGLFTNLSNNGNNLSITIGGTNKTLTVGYATKAAQLNTARTLWGQSFDGTGNVNGTLTNTNSAGSETIIRCSNTNGQIDLLTSVNRGVYDRTKTRWLIGTNGANSWLDCGNVGIGTTAPAYKLDVSGDARATNFRGALVGNAATATKLQTARTIWGQSFNGTANVSGSITGVNNITMSNNSYLYGKNTAGTAIQLIAMASWNSVDIGRGALVHGYTTQVMGKTVALTASDDSGKNVKSVELSTAKLYSNVTIETEGGLLAHGGVTAYSSSDIRLKQDLRKLDYLGIIKAMGGTFGFAWKKDNTRSIGWIAQHVLCNPHLKDIVETDENGYFKINYWSPKLIATAFGAIEQVGDEVSRLKARVVFLESEFQRLSGKQDGNNKKRLDNKNINLLN